MSQIFISYSRRDTETIDRIADLMSKAGLDVWVDRHDIRAGNQWRVQIVKAIDTCAALVLMLSPNSAASENVRREIDLAQDSGRPIFVVMLEPVKLPPEIRYQLAGLQFIDVQQLGFDESIKMLNETLKEHISTLQPAKEPEKQQAELVIQGIDINAFGTEKRQQLLDFVAQLTNSNRSNLSIAGMAAGSVHIFIDMPAESAYQLKTFALNRDNRFRRLRIVSLRLMGDKKFVNITLGVLTAAATIGFFQALWIGMPSLLTTVVGVAAGKVLTISLIAVVTTGLLVSVPKAIAPLMLPSPTPTNTLTATTPPTLSTFPVSQPSSQQDLTSTAEAAPRATSTLTIIATNTATLTEPPSPTPTPQNPLVLVNTACFKEPRANDKVVSRLEKGTRIKLVARSSPVGWWRVEDPIYRSLCWVQERDLQLDPGMRVEDIPIFYIFSQPTLEQPQCTASTTYADDPACYCSWYPSDPYCYSY